MGWGKTTYFTFFLQHALKETIYVTLPSKMLASDVQQSLIKAKALNKGS